MPPVFILILNDCPVSGCKLEKTKMRTSKRDCSNTDRSPARTSQRAVQEHLDESATIEVEVVTYHTLSWYTSHHITPLLHGLAQARGILWEDYQDEPGPGVRRQALHGSADRCAKRLQRWLLRHGACKAGDPKRAYLCSVGLVSWNKERLLFPKNYQIYQRTHVCVLNTVKLPMPSAGPPLAERE